MFIGSVDAGFVLALPFPHRDFERDCVGVSTKGRGAFAQGGPICGTLWFLRVEIASLATVS